jgi:ribosome maturation factor RimP
MVALASQVFQESLKRTEDAAGRDSRSGHSTVDGSGLIRNEVQGNADDAQGQQQAAAAVARVGWQTAISNTVEGLGYELVDIERAQRGLLRITIDRVPGRAYHPRGGIVAAGAAGDVGEFVTVEDCEKVTRQLQFALEVEGLDYTRLEVSSPGLDRPLKRPADYERFTGQAVQVVLKQPFKGRKNWQGLLTAADAAPLQAASGGTSVGGAEAPAQANPAAPTGWALVFKDGKTEQVLNFSLDEVREARLVPVVNFKGRKTPDGVGAKGPDAAPKQDGG